MSSPSRDNEEPSSSTTTMETDLAASGDAAVARPPAKRRISSTVIEISDTDSDDSDVCAVNSYQASADEVKRIRGEDYSSSSSSSEYSSDSETSWEDDSIVVDYKNNAKPLKAQLNPRANRMDNPLFNPKIKSQELLDRLQTHWKQLKDLDTPEVKLTCEPFRVCLLHDFLANPEMINNIVDDMNTLDWSRKKMDLYEFHQTADLASLTWQRSIRGIYELLKTEVMSWVAAATGLRLESVSASCSLYGPGDHLLVHDDLLADRRVAFILYLAPWAPPRPPTVDHRPLENGSGDHAAGRSAECGGWAPDTGGAAEWGGWAPDMGGALQLLARDAAGRPQRVVRSITPRNNTLAFFKVGADSFHQVEEVLSLELPRLSINGWFHGPAPEPELDAEPQDRDDTDTTLELQRPHNDIVVLSQWVTAQYLSPRVRLQVQAQMERHSEVSLQDLLQPGTLADLMRALGDPELPWELAGPADRCHYMRVPGSWAAGAPGATAWVPGEAPGSPGAGPVRAALGLLGSAAFVRMLADCTDLALTGWRGLELQRWAPGDYALLPPRAEYRAPRLEARLMLLPARAPGGAGGTRVYVAPEDAGDEAEAEAGEGGEADGALVSVEPTHNALSLVYCDAGAAAFTKYLTRLAPAPEPFYVFTCTYVE
uniref:uS12 prolyl 3-hydroxylase n=1 Tax=Spodoptera frugiperda TaxID=7108 RepID=A0A2H1WUM9_SPOFR